jgi:hypothetical protein
VRARQAPRIEASSSTPSSPAACSPAGSGTAERTRRRQDSTPTRCSTQPRPPRPTPGFGRGVSSTASSTSGPGEGAFPQRAALNQLAGRFLTDFYGTVAEWVEWATDIVEDWPDDVSLAAFDIVASEESVRLAERIQALAHRSASRYSTKP